MRQLPLQILPPSEPSFENFVPGDNAEALARVRELAFGQLREAIVYLWGEAGSGRTHLLRAAAHANASLVIADDTTVYPESVTPYLEYVRKAESGYLSVAVPLDDGLELSFYTGAARARADRAS